MAILYDLHKSKDNYILTVNQDTVYILTYNYKNSKEILETKAVITNSVITLPLDKDGVFTLTLSVEDETDVIETITVIKNLQNSITVDILNILCNNDVCFSSSTTCVSEKAKELLQLQNIFNKILTYQNLYIPTYSDNFLSVFANYLVEVVKLDTETFQTDINNIILEECIGDDSNCNFKLFLLYLYIYWTGMYFIEEDLVIDSNEEELEYIKTKFYYKELSKKYFNTIFNINNMKTIFNTTINLVEIYSFQLDTLQEGMDEVLSSNYNLTKETESLLLQGKDITYTKVAKVGFIIKNKEENPYKILDIFNNDVTTTFFDYIFNNNVSYYLSKNHISHSTLYFKFIKN